MFTKPALFSAAFAVVGVLAGCSSDADDLGMKVEKGCLRTRCDVRQAESSSYCGRCTSACLQASYDCDPDEACAVSCGDTSTYSCSDVERETCEQSGFTATLPSTKSDAVAVACRKMFDRAKSCGFETSTGAYACDTWAKTERADVAANYECIAALPCDDDGASCERANTDFGDRLCDGLAGVCGKEHCTSDVRAILNQQGGWLKDSVQSAGLACAAQSNCSDATQCFTVWATAASL